jgi:RNA polymerase sigma-70 factor, ECF subfamily
MMRQAMAAAREQDWPDGRLVQEVRAGSMPALGALYERHADMLYRTAYRFVGSREEAEEVVQDLFVGLRVALGSYAEQGRFGSWARRIVVRLAIDRSRRRDRERRTADYLGARASAAAAGDVSDAVALRDAIAALPPALREVFLLREAEGWTHQEIAELLGISPGTSMVRLMRAKKRLRRTLQ